MNAYTQFWSKYFDFKSYTSRKDYWTFKLIQIIIYVLFFYLGLTDVQLDGASPWFPVLSTYSVACLIPNFAMVIRRIRDTGRSPWNFCWVFLPFIGPLIVLLILVDR